MSCFDHTGPAIQLWIAERRNRAVATGGAETGARNRRRFRLPLLLFLVPGIDLELVDPIVIDMNGHLGLIHDLGVVLARVLAFTGISLSPPAELPFRILRRVVDIGMVPVDRHVRFLGRVDDPGSAPPPPSCPCCRRYQQSDAKHCSKVIFHDASDPVVIR